MIPGAASGPTGEPPCRGVFFRNMGLFWGYVELSLVLGKKNDNNNMQSQQYQSDRRLNHADLTLTHTFPSRFPAENVCMFGKRRIAHCFDMRCSPPPTPQNFDNLIFFAIKLPHQTHPLPLTLRHAIDIAAFRSTPIHPSVCVCLGVWMYVCIKSSPSMFVCD